MFCFRDDFLLLAKCRLPELEKQIVGYYMDDSTNEWYGKELQPSAYIRHGYTIKYQCQCPTELIQKCSLIKPAFIQCVDGQWTNGGPHCREGIYLLLSSLFFYIDSFL